MSSDDAAAPDDASIEREIARFAANALPLDASITVNFAGGVAILRGQVPSPAAATALADLVGGFAGVRAVTNLVTISEPESVARPRQEV